MTNYCINLHILKSKWNRDLPHDGQIITGFQCTCLKHKSTQKKDLQERVKSSWYWQADKGDNPDLQHSK